MSKKWIILLSELQTELKENELVKATLYMDGPPVIYICSWSIGHILEHEFFC